MIPGDDPSNRWSQTGFGNIFMGILCLETKAGCTKESVELESKSVGMAELLSNKRVNIKALGELE